MGLRDVAVRLVAPLVAAALASTGCSAEAPRSSTSDAAFGARVRAYLLAHPEVIEEAVQALETRRTAAAQQAATGAIRLRRADLESDPHDPVAGAPNGVVTLVEFFDYRCPYCKVAAPALPAFLKAHPNVRLVLKDYPILSPESEKAARLALASGLQGRYWAVHQALMKLPALSDDAMDNALRESGVDVARARVDAASAAITTQLAATHGLANALAINGTPSFVVGGEILAGWTPAEIDSAVKAATHPKAG